MDYQDTWANSAGNPSGSSPFTYDAQAAEIQRRLAIAKALDGFQIRTGQIIPNNYGGSFVGGAGWGDVLAKALTSYYGGKGRYDAAEAQKALDAQSRQEYRQALADYSTPSQGEINAVKDPAIYKYADPNAVGPTMDQLTGVQSSPVGQSSVQGNPLPAMQPAVRQQETPAQPTPQQIERFTSGAGNQWSGQSQDQLYAQLDALKAQRSQAVNALAFFRQGQNRAKDPAGAHAAEQKVSALDAQIKATEDAIAPPAGMLRQSLYGNPSPQAPAQKGPQAPVAPASSGQSPLAQVLAVKAAQAPQAAPAQQPAALAPVQQALAAQTPQRQNDFVVDAGALQGVKANLARMTAQRQADALDRLYYSGPRGKDEYEAIRKAELMRAAKEPTKLEFKGKDGETQGYMVNGQQIVNPFATTGGVVELKPSEKVSIMKAHSDDTKALGETTKQINSLNDGLTALDGARKLIGDVGTGPWQSYINTVASAVPGEYGGKVKALNAYFKSAAFQNARNTLVTNISDSDMKGFFASSPNDSWTTGQIMDYFDKFEKATREQLGTQQETAARYTSNINDYNKMLGRTDAGASSSPAASGARMINGIPAYQRGQTLRPQ